MVRPSWKNQGLHDFLMVGSVTKIFRRIHREIRELSKPLSKFLKGTAESNEDYDHLLPPPPMA